MNAIFERAIALYRRIMGGGQEEEEEEISHAAIPGEQFSGHQEREEDIAISIHEEHERQFICEYGFDDDDDDGDGNDDSTEEHEDIGDSPSSHAAGGGELMSDEEFDDDEGDEEFDDNEVDNDNDDEYDEQYGTSERQPRPLPLDLLKKKTVIPEDERVTCVICLENMQVGEQVFVVECSHKFHQVCLLEWLLNRRSCPLCRRKIFNSPVP